MDIPSTSPAISGRQFVALAAEACHASPKTTRVNLALLRMIGLFNKLIDETAEMYYQYQYDYVFDSTKFEQRFGIKATCYADGIQKAATRMKQ